MQGTRPPGCFLFSRNVKCERKNKTKQRKQPERRRKRFSRAVKLELGLQPVRGGKCDLDCGFVPAETLETHIHEGQAAVMSVSEKLHSREVFTGSATSRSVGDKNQPFWQGCLDLPFLTFLTHKVAPEAFVIIPKNFQSSDLLPPYLNLLTLD